MQPTDTALDFTGERFTPECVREMWYEHWHRYALARQHAHGKRVLDAACGEGYGAALLADGADAVVAIDLSEQALAHAKQRYGARSNLQFVQASVDAVDFPAASFNLITSFETLEHVPAAAQEKMLGHFARMLKPDGLLLISTPDRRVYSDLTGYRNEFHEQELYRHEFEALLRRHFADHVLLGQKLLFQSVVFPVTGPPSSWSASTLDEQSPQPGLGYEPVYFIAACAHDPAVLGAFRGRLDLFGDRRESVYSHYNDEIRKGIHLAGILADKERKVAELLSEIEALKAASR